MHVWIAVNRQPRGRSRTGSGPSSRNVACPLFPGQGQATDPGDGGVQARLTSPRSAQAAFWPSPDVNQSIVRNRTEALGFTLRADLQPLETIVRQTSATLLEFIKWALRANYDDVTREPLPQRWIALINDLDQRERAEPPAGRRGQITR